MATTSRAPRFVKVLHEIGYGDRMFRVVGERGSDAGREVQLEGEGKLFWICYAHTYQDMQCRMATAQARKSAVEAFLSKPVHRK